MNAEEIEWYFKNYNAEYIVIPLVKKIVKTNNLKTILKVAYNSNNKYAIKYLENHFQEEVLKYSIDSNNLELFQKIINKYPEIRTENEKLNIFNKIQTQINLYKQEQERIEQEKKEQEEKIEQEKRKKEEQIRKKLNKTITMWEVTKNLNNDYLYLDD